MVIKLSGTSLDEKFFTKSVIGQDLNVPEDPCVEDDQYNFGVCVKESLARQVGCRPSWDVWSDQTIRNCTEIDEHRWESIF